MKFVLVVPELLCNVTPFRVPVWLTLGYKCTRTSKHRRG